MEPEERHWEELLRAAAVVLLPEAVEEEEEEQLWATMLGSVEGMGFPSLVWSFTTCAGETASSSATLRPRRKPIGRFAPPPSYLLVLGSADVRGVGVGSGAGDVAQLAAELVLGAAGQGSAPAATSSAPAAAALGDFQRRLLLLVLLAFQVLLVGLNRTQTITCTLLHHNTHNHVNFYLKMT